MYFTQKQWEDRTRKAERYKRIKFNYKAQGLFIWALYELNNTYSLNLSKATLVRLIYLVTYADYKGLLKNNGRPMSRTDIFEVMNLSINTFDLFMKEVFKQNFIFNSTEGYKINLSYFSKGSLNKKSIAKYAEINMYYTRLYINGIRTIYNKTSARLHKTLSTVFLILPYVNRYYNIVCENPLEDDVNKIIPLSLNTLCNIIGYDSEHSDRLVKELYKPQYPLNGDNQPIIKYLTPYGLKTAQIFVNPYIYYAGNKWDEVKILGNFKEVI